MVGMERDSAISGFYKMSVKERVEKVKEYAGLEKEDVEKLRKYAALDEATADRMVENVIGTTQLPLGVATNFKVNGRDYLIPMALEEPSVVAAASNAAKLARPSGFVCKATDPVMIGQIQVVNIKDFQKAKEAIEKGKKELLESANSRDSMLVKFGGGARDIEVREAEFEGNRFMVLHLLVDVKDAMGANAVNTMCEHISPKIEGLTGGEARMRIISNLAVHRTVKARAVWKKDLLGEEVIGKILEAYAFAAADIFRAATHNKGIMNGIDAVLLATINDWRAVEAGAHTFAGMDGKYRPLTRYSKDKEGNLVGELEMPMAVATVGGATRTHPIALVAFKILGVENAKEFAEVLGAVGLAQNFAAMRALATEGIQKGHMRLHARNIAVIGGCEGKYIDIVADKMVKEGNISAARAKELLEEVE